MGDYPVYSLLAIILIGLAEPAKDVPLSPFKAKQCYTYRYDAQLVTGSPVAQLWSGLRVSARLDVCFLSEVKVAAKMTKVRLYKMDKPVAARTPDFFLQDPASLLDGVEAEVTEVMVKPLQRPFTFTWKKGFVTEVKFIKDDPLWSTNIKRGVVSLFQVNLDQKYSVDPIVTKDADYKGTSPSYTVWEPSTFGYCKTRYTPQPAYGARTFYLTKVRDYSSCLKTSPMVHVFDNVWSAKAQNSSETSEHLQYKAEVTYAIQGEVKDFIILEAIGESKFTFVPYAQQDGSVQTSINQTLYLVTRWPFSGSSPLGSAGTTKEKYSASSLELIPPARSFEDREPYQEKGSPWPDSGTTYWDISKLDQLLAWAANGTATYPSEKVLTTLHLLTEMIRYSRPQLLQALLQRVAQEKEREKAEDSQGTRTLASLKHQIYWDLLCSAATTPALTTVLTACLTSDSYPGLHGDCFQAVTSAGIYAPPSDKTISLLISLLIKKQGDRKLRDVIGLALGSMMGRAEDVVVKILQAGNKHLDVMRKILEVKSAKDMQQELIKTMKRKEARLADIAKQHHAIEIKFEAAIRKVFLQSSADSNLIVALQAYRNAHVALTWPVIARYLTNNSLAPAVRITAAQAMEKFVQASTKAEISRVLEQVLKNPQELTALRIQCFRTLVNIRGPKEIFLRLAESLRYEDQKQMAAYVWSAVDQLRNSTFPPHQDISAVLQSVATFLSPIDVGVQDSRYGHYHRAVGDKMGFLHAASFVSTTDGNYSSILELSHVHDVFGVANKAFALSWVSTGLQKLMKRMVGPEGFFTNQNSLSDLLQRARRSADSKSDIRDIFHALGVNSQLRDIADPQAFLSIQLMNNVVRTWHLNDLLQDLADLNQIVKSFHEGALRSGYPLHLVRAGKRMQFFLDLPSEAGFPIRLQMGATYALKVSGQVSAGVDTSVFKDPPGQIWAQLELDPRIVASLSGKISVDGYLLNTGSAFHALATLKTPVHVRASFQPGSNRFTIRAVPAVHETRPVVSVEARPYVYCLVVSNSLTRPQADVNRRPYFLTTQPLLAASGARVNDFRYQLGKDLLGVDVTWQGAYPWRGEPGTPAAPMAGRSYAALYFRPGEHTPPEICVDMKYLTKPRYMEPKASRRAACNSWWSFLGWECYGTTVEQDGVPNDQARAQPTRVAPPAGDFPDLGSDDVTLDAVRARMEQLAGEKIPEPTSSSQRALILLVNASSSSLQRAYGLQVLRHVWQAGRHHAGFYNLYRTPVPGYDDKPWRLFGKTHTTFPEQATKFADLLSSSYVAQTYSDLLDLMRPREHRVINRQFRSLVYTELSRLTMWELPSLDPAAMMDRSMVENVYLCQDSVVCSQVKSILKKLLPLADETWELKTEMKDPLKITSSQDLLLEKVRQVSSAQNETAALLTLIPESLHRLQPHLAAAVQYLVVKTSQALVELGNIINRGHRLGLLEFNSATLDLQQQVVFSLASAALSWNSPPQQSYALLAGQGDSFDQSEASKAGHSTVVDSVDNDVSVDNVEVLQDRPPWMDVEQVVQGFQSLNNLQLQVISHCWSTLVAGRRVEVTELRQLLETARDNVTALSRLMTECPHCRSPDLTGLLLQGALQHQTLIYLLESPHLAPTPDLDQPASEDTMVSPADRYALKVQFKQLTERALLFQEEEKSNMTCLGLLTEQERDMMLQLYRMGRHLVVFLQAYFRQPDQTTPWTSSADDIQAAFAETGFPTLTELREMREMLLRAGRVPQPCLVMKLVETTLGLQRQLALLSRTLSAQLDYDETLNEQASQLSEQTTDLLMSLRDVFDLYVDLNADTESLTPAGDRAPGPQDSEPAGPTTGLRTTDCAREICFGANITYGGPDEPPKRLAIRVHGRKSLGQKLWEVRQFSSETRDACVSRTVRASLTGRDRLETCPHFVHDALNTFTHLHLYVHGDELWAPLTDSYCPALGYDVLERLLTSLEGRHWDRSAVYRPVLTRDGNTVQAVLDLHPSLTSADHYYLTPTRTLALRSLPVPAWVQAWYPFQNVLPTSKLALLKMSSAHLPGMCKVQGDSVRTADGAVLSLPWGWWRKKEAPEAQGRRGCRALLAGDCSSDAAFAVTLLLNDSLPSHGIEILAEEHSVVIQPYDQGDYTVYVDGTMEELTNNKPLVFYKKIAYGIETVAMVVSRDEEGYIRSEYPQLDLDFFVNFQYINIEMSGVYRGQLCGLCGNFDFQTTQELVDGPGRVYPDADGFFRSYLIPDRSCHLVPQKEKPSLYVQPSNTGSGHAASDESKTTVSADSQSGQ